MMKKNKPHYLGHRQRLRERFLTSGLEGFANYEVVELLLTLAIPRADVKQLAKALIARFGNLRGILDAPIEELRSIPRIGSVTPVALQIIKSAATLYLQQSSEGQDSLADPALLADFWRMRIGAFRTRSSRLHTWIRPTGFCGTVWRPSRKAPSIGRRSIHGGWSKLH